MGYESKGGFFKRVRRDWIVLLVLLLSSPVFLSIIFSFPIAINEFSNTPTYINEKINSIFYIRKQEAIAEFRFAAQKDFLVKYLANVYYNNKLYLLGEEVFNYLIIFSPNFYFQAGDGTNLSPKNIEPLSILLIPFWFVGLLISIKNRKWKIFVPLFIFAALVYLTGRRSVLFAFPIFVIYAYFAFVGINSISNLKAKKIVLGILLIYSLFLYGRILWNF